MGAIIYLGLIILALVVLLGVFFYRPTDWSGGLNWYVQTKDGRPKYSVMRSVVQDPQRATQSGIKDPVRVDREITQTGQRDPGDSESLGFRTDNKGMVVRKVRRHDSIPGIYRPGTTPKTEIKNPASSRPKKRQSNLHDIVSGDFSKQEGKTTLAGWGQKRSPGLTEEQRKQLPIGAEPTIIIEDKLLEKLSWGHTNLSGWDLARYINNIFCKMSCRVPYVKEDGSFDCACGRLKVLI